MTDADFDWMRRGACRDYPTKWWFPHSTEHGTEAKRICSQCQVKVECLAYSVGDESVAGIWGEKSERQRRELRWRERGRAEYGMGEV